MPEPLLVAKAKEEIFLLPGLANRHGLIAGATGTGKTVTLQCLAEGFSRIGVPVFMADVKGDLAGLSQKGEAKGKIKERIELLKLDGFTFDACPVVFWDAFGQQGHPVRATISEMGPLLLARMLNLNDTQQGVLTLAFKIADDNGLLLLDLKDLRAILQFVGDNAKSFTTQYGNVSVASIGAIQRGLLELEHQGADRFFAEPALNINDLMQTDGKGRGVINILAADKLMNAPKLYGTFLLWLLAELFEQLPEVGDPEKPKLVFFFDEAHMLFTEAPAALLEKIEQVVRLIRSKGVGVYFVTQNPLDIPDTVLGQLGNRVQHALRAFTPRDQKAVKAAATTLRANPGLDVENVITELGVGEALVSLLDEKGRPTIVERAFVVPPGTRVGPITPEERAAIIQSSVLNGVYDKVEDRESAYEKLTQRVGQTAASSQPLGSTESTGGQQPPAASGGGILGTLGSILGGSTGPRGGHREGMIEAAAKSAARSIGSQIGRDIVREGPGPFWAADGGVDSSPLVARAARVNQRGRPGGYLAAGLLLAIGGVVFFSLRPILIKLAYEYVVDPVTLLALRMTFAVPFFLAAAFWVQGRDGALPLARRDIAAVVVLGLLSYYLASFLDFLGLQYISAGLGRLLQFIYPTVVVILSALFLGKRPTRRDVVALVLTYSGLLLVFWHAIGGEQRDFFLGAGLVLASATCYAVYLVAGTEVIARVGSVRFTAYAMIVASVACVAQFFLLRPLSALNVAPAVYGLSFAMAIVSTVIPGFMVSEALRRIGANKVAIIGALGPVTAIVLGYLGLDEIMTPLQIAGSALVLVGVVVISVKPKPPHTHTR